MEYSLTLATLTEEPNILVLILVLMEYSLTWKATFQFFDGTKS